MRPRVKMKSILIQDGGQGDGIMSANCLQALLELNIRFLDSNAVCYTRSAVEPLIRIMLPDIRVENLTTSKGCAHPRYHIISKISSTTVFRNYLTKDFYVNFAERRRRASYGYPNPTLFKKIMQWLTDAKLAQGPRWRRETPAYYGIRMWAPLAEACSVSETDLLRGLYLSHQTISRRLKAYAEKLKNTSNADLTNKIAIFPGGKSFQYLPPAFLKKIVSETGLNSSQYACFFSPEDKSITHYKSENLTCEITPSIDDVLFVAAHAKATATADSFVSHIAQLLANKHIALMSHDLPQHTIHPAANSAVVYEPMKCCPCHYANRTQNSLCPAGYPVCGVFFSDSYLEKAVHTLRKCLAS